jgi:hypothetical protein
MSPSTTFSAKPAVAFDAEVTEQLAIKAFDNRSYGNRHHCVRTACTMAFLSRTMDAIFGTPEWVVPESEK